MEGACLCCGELVRKYQRVLAREVGQCVCLLGFMKSGSYPPTEAGRLEHSFLMIMFQRDGSWDLVEDLSGL